jgi:phosphoheptose isomerase
MSKKIALISEHASPLATLGGVDSGGQNVYVAHVSRQLAAQGYQVDIFTRRDSEDLPEIVPWAEVGAHCDVSTGEARVVHVPAGSARFVRKEDLLGLMGEFRDWMLDFFRRGDGSYDLIHANFWMSGLVAADIKEILGIPFVITFHALGRVRRQHQRAADEFPDERFAIEERIVAEADAIIAECPQDEEDLIRLYQADQGRITIIPCGFDPEEIGPINRAEARAELGLPADEPIILHLGRMVPRKGIETVIRGMGHLLRSQDFAPHAQHFAPRLIVVGGESEDPDPELTPEIGRLQAIAEEEGIADRVTFSGRRRRDMLRYYYSAADVFVTTPWYEPFGITPVEAMACGTPVIGSRVGGVKYTVADGVTGYLVPPRNPEAVAQQIAVLLKDADLLARLGKQARERANRLFTWSKVGKAMAALYEEVLAGRQPEEMPATDKLELIDEGFDAILERLKRSRRLLRPSIVMAGEAMTTCLMRGNKILACGNGGSATDAQHLVGELVGRFKALDRPALPAISLNADTAVLTAWANDVGYDRVFARQVEALGRPGDVLIGISTSGESRNLMEAFQIARGYGLQCIALLGKDGGKLLELSDIAVVVPSFDTQRIQEIHTLVLHLLCELVEQALSVLDLRFQPVAQAPKVSRNGRGYASRPAVNGLQLQRIGDNEA